MNDVLIELTGLVPAAVHTVKLDLPRVELRLVLHDPVSGTTMVLPANVDVALVDGEGKRVATARVREDGRATLFAPADSRNVGIEVDFAAAPYLDLISGAFVSVEDAQPDTKRRLVRLPDRWRTVDQPELSDDRGGKMVDGRVSEIVQGELGTPDAPWELDLGHAWQRTELVFQYYDVTAKVVRPVVYGPLVEAYDDHRLRERDLVAASTVLDTDGRVHLMLFRRVEPDKLRIRFRTAVNTVVATTEADPELRVRRVAEAELKAMTVAQRQAHYPLPREWLSRGQACRIDESTSARARWFEDAVGDALDVQLRPPRLYFDLDDFVLVNATGLPLRFAREIDVTIFHHDMSIRAPRRETHQAYFTDIPAGHNHFSGNAAFYSSGSGAEKTTRVIRRGKTSYDLGNRRTVRGRVIGVRAAVADDHPQERVFGTQDGKMRGFANFDLHYFEDVASDPTQPERSISALMICFTTRIRSFMGETLQLAFQDALVRAAERWGGTPLADVLAGTAPVVPDVRLRTDDAAHDVKFVFHFPALDDRVGHAVTWIVHDIRSFAVASAGMILLEPGDERPKPAQGGVEHGFKYAGEVVAHELGHAMGLPDEYFERLGTMLIPAAHQYPWNLPHLSFDEQSMMNDGYEPRLRHYWVFSRWLEDAADVPRVESSHYALICDTSGLPGPGTGRLHRFGLPSEHAWPFRPVAQEKRYRPGDSGRGSLSLYLLGDEFDAFKLTHTGVLDRLDAVLHWDLLLYVRRRRNARGEQMSLAKRNRNVRDLYNELAEAAGTTRWGDETRAKRCLVAELDSSQPASSLAQRHARRVLLYILPRVTFSNPAAADFRIHLRLPTFEPRHDVTDLHDPTFRGRKIRIHTAFPGRALLRYMMGQSAASVHMPARIRIDTTPLPIGPTFSVGTAGAQKLLRAVAGRRTSGANDYDARGAPGDVAADITAAINDPANAYASHLSAVHRGREVVLTARTVGAGVVVEFPPPGATVEREWGGLLGPSDVQFVADWIGEQLGGTYRVSAYD